MAEKKRDVKTDIRIPVFLFLPLIRSCFNEEATSKDVLKAIIPNFLPVYCDFKNLASKGRILTSKDSFGEYKDMLFSENDLISYKKEICSCKGYVSLRINIPSYIVSKMEKLSYPASEEYGGSQNNKNLFRDIERDALAYFYWCMERINEGKRIGFISLDKNNPGFYDMDMQKFFPRYNEKKAYCIEEKDFLLNAPKKDIQEAFVEMISNFRKEVQNKRNESTLSELEKRIRLYSSKLEWNPEKFFENCGRKKPEPENK